MVAFATQVKRRRGTQEQNDAFTGAEGEIVVDLTNMTLRVHDGRTRGGFVVGGGAGRNIGDIFFTARTDTSLNGAVEANGGQYNTTDFAGAQSIGTMLSAGKVPYITLADYQTAVDTYGSCGFFGWDGGTEFRVPKLADVFIETGIAAQVGQYLSAGLPNITGAATFSYGTLWPTTMSGAFKTSGTRGTRAQGEGGTSPADLQIDASLSSSVYGNSDTVQPPAIRYRPMVQLANGATDEAVVVAGNVLADISDIRQQIDALDVVIESQLPTADNGYTWYRKYKSGWVEQGGYTNIVNITLPVEMLNSTEYTALVQYNPVDGDISNGAITVENKTTTGFDVQRYASGTDEFSWQVSGMAAQ